MKRQVHSVLESHGLKRVNADDFGSAFARTGWITSLVFLTVDAGDDPIGPNELRELISRARGWCAIHVKAKWFFKECGLNLVIFHNGQLDSMHLVALPDSIGNHAAILQSITSVDQARQAVILTRTWIVVGRLWFILRKLRAVS